MSENAGSAHDSVTIRSTDGSTTATFIPGSNLVCSSLRYRGADWLDPIRAAQAAESGKDYGISLVHPWSGRLERFGYSVGGEEVVLSPDDDQIPHDKFGVPIHGVWDRLLGWELAEATEHELVAHLSWKGEQLLSVFPFPHELRVTASIDTAQLRVRTELRPTATVGVPVSYGYHAFLRIPGSSRSNWTVTLEARKRVVVDDHQIPTGETIPLLERAFDLGQESVNDDVAGIDESAQLAFSDGQLTVAMTLEEGFTAAHLFAPAEQDLVSFEPMTAAANALNSGAGLRIVEPGGAFRSGFTIQLPR